MNGDDTYDDFPRVSPGPNRRQDQTAGVRVVVGYLTLALTIGSLIFTAGYNWRRISEVAEKHDALAQHLADDYVRKDVVTAQLDEIKIQLAMLERAAERMADRQAGR